MPNRPGSSSTTRVRQPDPASSPKVVHCCPEAGTHCRSSAQIAQTSTFSECSTAQVVQIQKSTVSRLLGRSARGGRTSAPNQLGRVDGGGCALAGALRVVNQEPPVRFLHDHQVDLDGGA